MKQSYKERGGVLVEIPYGQPRFSIFYDSQSSYASCIASKVICMNDVPASTRKPANCRLKVDTRGRKAYIVAFTYIPEVTELFIYAMNI
jgi:hypothetical protein